MSNSAESSCLIFPESGFRTIEKNGIIFKYAEFGEHSIASTHHIKMWMHNNHTGLMLEWHNAVSWPRMGIANDMMSLVEIHRGTWDLFEHDHYNGRSIRLQYGAHQLMDMGFNDILSSFRAV